VTLFRFFNTWGILGLSLFAIGYAASHFFWIKKLKQLEFCSKLIGFIGLASVLILSGWKAALISLPIGIAGSLIGLFAARALFGKPHQESD
jgi:hypothetical protein